MDINNIQGYHLSPIQKGVYGELSKICEELDELRDAADHPPKTYMC